MNDKTRDRRDEALDRMFAGAREASPDLSAVSHGFEARLLARIRESRLSRESWRAWTWRLVPYLLALTILAGAWSTLLSPAHPADPGSLLASGAEDLALVDSLTGD